MYEDWIAVKQTCLDHDIEKDFGIPKHTLKKWRLAGKGPMHFRLGDKILYPRVGFVQWFEGHTKNKPGVVEPIVPIRTKANISEK